MPYKNLKVFIEQSENSSEEILKLTLLLGNPEILVFKRWRHLSNQFFVHHQKEILAWCKYENLVEKIPPVTVTETEVLIDVFSGMKRTGLFGKCSFEKLALCMLGFFRIGLNAKTLSNRLSASDGYSFKKIWRDYWGKKAQ